MIETREQWYKPNLLYNIHYRPPKKLVPPKMIVETVRYNPSVCTCGKHGCEPRYRMEKRVLWTNKEVITAKEQGNRDEIKQKAVTEVYKGKFQSIEDKKKYYVNEDDDLSMYDNYNKASAIDSGFRDDIGDDIDCFRKSYGYKAEGGSLKEFIRNNRDFGSSIDRYACGNDDRIWRRKYINRDCGSDSDACGNDDRIWRRKFVNRDCGSVGDDIGKSKDTGVSRNDGGNTDGRNTGSGQNDIDGVSYKGIEESGGSNNGCTREDEMSSEDGYSVRGRSRSNKNGGGQRDVIGGFKYYSDVDDGKKCRDIGYFVDYCEDKMVDRGVKYDLGEQSIARVCAKGSTEDGEEDYIDCGSERSFDGNSAGEAEVERESFNDMISGAALIRNDDIAEDIDTCTQENAGMQHMDEEISCAFGIMSVYCNSEIHSWMRVRDED